MNRLLLHRSFQYQKHFKAKRKQAQDGIFSLQRPSQQSDGELILFERSVTCMKIEIYSKQRKGKVRNCGIC